MIYEIVRNIIVCLMRPMSLFKKRGKNFIHARLHQNIDILTENADYIWIHGASVGEMNLAESFVKKLSSRYHGRILVTCMTDTGYELISRKYSDMSNVNILLFPVDDPKILKQIINRINLEKLIIIETEIWPNLIKLVSPAQVIMINGRISDRSYKRYMLIQPLLKKILARIDMYFMQSANDRDRIIHLGADESKVSVVGNLKFDIQFEDYESSELAQENAKMNIGNRKIFVGGSTRTGEDEILLDAMTKLKNTVLILAPRHLERLDKLAETIEKYGFTYSLYSQLERIDKENNNIKQVDVIIIDKMGLLRKMYALCDYAFVGGTLVNIGGHSLLEPLYYHKTPIFGKYLQNVRDISKALLDRNIGYLVNTSKNIADCIANIEARDSGTRDSINSQIDEFFCENKNVAGKILEKLEI